MTTAAQRVIAVFGASHASQGDGYYEDAFRCGRLLAEAGFAVATGGYGGLMEAVSAGAAAGRGHVIGVTAPPVFPGRDRANEYVVEERMAESLTERIHDITDLSDASITLHGSLGTATELLVAWNLAFVARFSQREPDPVIAVGPRWERVVNLLADELDTDRTLITCVATVDEAVDIITRTFATG